MMTPQIRTMRERFIVDFDDVIGAGFFNALALGGLDGDPARQFGGRRIQAFYQFPQPVIGKFHR